MDAKHEAVYIWISGKVYDLVLMTSTVPCHNNIFFYNCCHHFITSKRLRAVYEYQLMLIHIRMFCQRNELQSDSLVTSRAGPRWLLLCLPGTATDSHTAVICILRGVDLQLTAGGHS